MPRLVNDPLEYYAHPGLMTDPGEHAGLFDDSPSEIPTQGCSAQDAALRN